MFWPNFVLLLRKMACRQSPLILGFTLQSVLGELWDLFVLEMRPALRNTVLLLSWMSKAALPSRHASFLPLLIFFNEYARISLLNPVAAVWRHVFHGCTLTYLSKAWFLERIMCASTVILAEPLTGWVGRPSYSYSKLLGLREACASCIIMPLIIYFSLQNVTCKLHLKRFMV